TILKAKQLLSAFCYYPLLMAWGGGVFTLHLYCIRHSVIPNWGTINLGAKIHNKCVTPKEILT
ncbi:hypothetical protein, partial [Metaprevotella massiliensis]|uniref:hypothetical protein n=1 Tax=Metaprevotella massiliensis TaxID=1870999 RepID=UPI001CA478F3